MAVFDVIDKQLMMILNDFEKFINYLLFKPKDYIVSLIIWPCRNPVRQFFSEGTDCSTLCRPPV